MFYEKTMLYDKYRYLYPTRAEAKTNPADIGRYDNGEYLAQPKYNGSCCNVFMNDAGFLKVMGREKNALTLVDFNAIDFLAAFKGSGWMVLSGELLNKNKKGENGKPFNQKFVIWDILVYDSKYLVQSTVEQRLLFLEELYPCRRMTVTGSDFESYEHTCITGLKGIYKSPTYESGFSNLYTDLIKTDVYEGLVIKRKEGKLQFGYNSRNNHEWQIKCRKPTQNYHQ